MGDDNTNQRCDYCCHPIPLEPVTETVDGQEYVFCSVTCRDELVDRDQVLAKYHGARYARPGVDGFDQSLPQGLPRNSLVLLSGEAGTRLRAFGIELVWRTLRRDEPAVIVTYEEPPGAIVQQFLALEWNVLPYLERDQLHLIDCFTYRLDVRDRMFDRLNDWNRHLYQAAETATSTLRDPSDTGSLLNVLDNALESLEMSDEGAVMVDSLTELGTLLQPVQAYDLVKSLRAEVCKGRYVPVFACATRKGPEDVEFPHDLEYLVDGIVDLRLNPELVADTLIKQFRVRKLNGALAISEWRAYEYTETQGLVPFDPQAQIEKSRRKRAEVRQPFPDDDSIEAQETAGDDRDSNTTVEERRAADAASTDETRVDERPVGNSTGNTGEENSDCSVSEDEN